jgi:hypothetical protein
MGDVVTLVEKAQQAFDQDEAARLNKKIRKNQFDFNDFLSQLQQVKKMGNMKDLLGMIPGMGKAMKDVDMSKIKLDMEKAMKDIDWNKIKIDIDESMAKVDWDKIKLDIDKVKEINFDKLKIEMDDLKIDLEKMGPEIRKSMDAAKVEIEKAKVELKEYKTLVDDLDKQGLINKKDGYKIEHKDGKLLINGKDAPAGVYEKHKAFLKKHETFSINQDEDNFNIDLD